MLVMEVGGLLCLLTADDEDEDEDEDEGRLNVYTGALCSPPPARSATFLKCLSCLKEKRCPRGQMYLKAN